MYLSIMSVSVVRDNRSRHRRESGSSDLVWTKPRSRPSFRVLSRPGATTADPNALATTAANLQGEQAVAVSSAWKLVLI